MHHSTSEDFTGSSKSIAIIGGGISGLIVAYRLLKLSNNTYKITIIESGSRLGGFIQSSIHEFGTTLEQGPRSIRFSGASGRTTLNLVIY